MQNTYPGASAVPFEAEQRAHGPVDEPRAGSTDTFAGHPPGSHKKPLAGRCGCAAGGAVRGHGRERPAPPHGKFQKGVYGMRINSYFW